MSREDAETLNSAGRMSMIEGYRSTPYRSSDSEHFKKAERLYRRAHESDPSNPHYTLNLADALFALGCIDEANRYFSEALPNLRPDSNHLQGVRRRWNVQL